MNKCKICSREFDGKFCPYCGTPASEESIIKEISNNSLPLSSNFNELLKNPVPTSVSEFTSRVMTDGTMNTAEDENEKSENEAKDSSSKIESDMMPDEIKADEAKPDEQKTSLNEEAKVESAKDAKKKSKEKKADIKNKDQKGKEGKKNQKTIDKKTPNYVKKNGGVVTVYKNYKKRDRALGISLAVICAAVIVAACIFVAPAYSKYWINNIDITTLTLDTITLRLGEPIDNGHNEYMWAKGLKDEADINEALQNGKKVEYVAVKAVDNKVKIFIYNADFKNNSKLLESVSYSSVIVSDIEDFNKITFESRLQDGSVVKAYLADCSVIGKSIDFNSKTTQTYTFSDGLINHTVEITVK